ncbi:MAG TPA: glycosyltransferase [Patescibacteria group bacterium]|nr:glycosyltransferase [Patescibacteria group bacterium]
MKILEINKFYYPRRGAERHFLDLIELLKQVGHEVAVFTMNNKHNVSRAYEKYFVSYVGYNKDDATLWQRIRGIGRLFWSLEARKKIAGLTDDFQPDIVHIHNAYHQLSLSFLPIIKRQHIPVVMTVHDYNSISPDKDAYYDTVGKQYWKFLFIQKYTLGKRLLLVLKMYWEKIWQFYANSVDIYISPSEYCKDILVKGGIPAEKIIVIPHFVTIPDTQPIIADANHTPYALYIGSITPEKNIAELCEIFEKLQFPFVLAGMKQMTLPESHYVRYVGEKNKEDIQMLIQRSQCVVSASRLPETFGLIALEANICGKPFFGYQTGAYPEIIINGKNGWLANDRVMLENALSDFMTGNISCDTPDSIAHFAKEHYSPHTYVQKINALFERLQK